MSQFLGFGNGVDGIVTLSGADSPIDSAATGAAGSTSLSATNASFTAGQIILIHQTTKSTGGGAWELNQISSYVAGTITTVLPLANAYTAGAQVLVVKQYSGVTISGTLTAKAWDGTVGGILAFLCNGLTTISGTITASGKGFIGGAGRSAAMTSLGYNGLSDNGVASSITQSSNGAGGGGGRAGDGGSGAGGAGHVNAGNNGSGGGPVSGGGDGSRGLADLTTMVFGAGGGGGVTENGTVGAGGNGGGLVLIFSNRLTISGSIVANGDNGVAGIAGTKGAAGSGAGSGGSIFLKGVTLTLGSGLATASGGTGGANGVGTGVDAGQGGNASVGRVRVECCSLSGTTTPSASQSLGGFGFCASANQII